MEFAWNLQKNGISDIKGLEHEQERKGKISNPDIDPNRTNLNYDLVESNLNLYQRVKKRVDEVRPASRVQKNSVVDCSNIITVSQLQCQEWGIEKSKEYLKSVYDYFCEEFGKENVVSAKIHLDETTPHMHLHFVPVSDEGKLQARQVITRERINKVHTEAPKYLQNIGFDVVRGEGKTGKSLDIEKFKVEKLKEEMKDIEMDLVDERFKAEKLEKEIKTFEDKLSSVKIDFNTLIDTKDSLNNFVDSVDSLKTKKSLIGSNVTLKDTDYESLVSMAKDSIKYKFDLDKTTDELLKSQRINEGSRKLTNEIIEYRHSNFEKDKEIESLKNEIKLNENDLFSFLEENHLMGRYAEFKQNKDIKELENKKKYNKSYDLGME